MLNTNDLLARGAVKRWSTLNTSRVQTLAEHQYNAVILTIELANRLNWANPKIVAAAAYALVRGSEEVHPYGMHYRPSKTSPAGSGEPTAVAVNALFTDYSKNPLDSQIDAKILELCECADYMANLIFLGEHAVGKAAGVAYSNLYEEAHDFFGVAGDTGKTAAIILSEIQDALHGEKV